MKKLIAVMIAILILPNMQVCAEGYSEYYDSLVSDSGIMETADSLPDYAKDLLDEYGEGILSGEDKGLLEIVAGLLKDSFSSPAKFLLICIAAILLYSLMRSVDIGKGDSTVQYICVLALAGGCMLPFGGLIKDTALAIEGIGKFMLTFLPVFAGILIAAGSVTTASVSSGLLLAAAQGVSAVISNLVLPVISLFMSLSLASCVTDIKTDGIISSIKKLCGWVLGISLGLFTGILGLQTVVSGAADTLSLKTVKFAAGTFLPVVGGSVSDALGTVISCLKLLRSSAGAYGVLGIAFVILPILLQLIVWRFVLLIGESAAQLFSAEKIAKLLSGTGFVASVLIGVALWTALLFIISLTVLIKAGGV